MFESYKVAVRLNLVNGVTSGLVGIIGQFNTLNRTVEGTRRHMTALERDIAQVKKTALVGGALAGAGLFGLSMMGGPLKAATEYEKAYARFKTLNLGDAINAQADKFARGAKVFGVSSTEMMEGLRSSIGLFNDFDMAKKLTPMIAELNKANAMLFNGNVSALDDAGVRALMKFIDRRGGNANEADFRRNLDLAQRMVTGSGGAIKFQDLAQFSQYGGTAFRGLSDEGLLRMSGLLQEQGGAKAGTALMSVYQNLIAGRTPKKTMALLQQMGLGEVGMVNAGIINGKPFQSTVLKNIKGAELLQSDPVAWIQSVLLPTLASKGITKEGDILRTVNDLLSNRNASGQMSITATQLQTVLRDFEVTKRAMGVQGTLDASRNTRAGQLMNYQAQMENLRIELGMTILPLAVKVTKQISSIVTSLSEFANKHPGFAKAIMYTVGGLSALALLGGSIMLASAGIKALGIALAFSGIGGAGGVAKAGLALAAFGRGIAAMAFAVMTNPYVMGILAAGGAGYAVGKGINSMLSDGAKDSIGRNVARVLAFFGNDEAQAALDAEKRINPVSGRNQRPVQVNSTVMLDGRKVGESVTQHIVGAATRTASGGTSYDPTRLPYNGPFALGN